MQQRDSSENSGSGSKPTGFVTDEGTDSSFTQSQMEAAIELMDDGVFLFEVERENAAYSFRFVGNNSTHEEVTGMTEAEYTGKELSDFLAEDAAVAVEERYRRCVERKEPIEYRETLTHPEGTVEWHTKLTPVLENEEVTHLLGIARDISERLKREWQLEEQREWLRALFDNAPDGIVVHDEEGRVLEVNDAVVEMLDYDRSELLSMQVQDFETALDPDELRNHWQGLEPGYMQRVGVDGCHRRADGSTYPVEVWVSKLPAEHSVPLDTGSDSQRLRDNEIDQTETEDSILIALVRDISERRQYERELQYSEEKYRTVFSESRDALMLLDQEGYRECNQAALDLFGVDSPDEISKYTPWGLSPDTQPDGRSSERAATEYIETALEEGSAFFEWTHERTDGTEFVAEVKLSLVELGEDRLLQAVVRDVTDRIKYEAALEAERDFLDSIIEGLPFPFYVLDADTYTVEHANQRAVVSEGDTCYEVTHDRAEPCDEGEQPLECPIDEIKRREEPHVVEHVHHDADGNERVFRVHAAPLFEDDGRLTRIAESNIDITERVEYEQLLEEQRDNLELLNQVVRHDIRNDLQIIQAYGELLTDYVDEAGATHLETLLKSTENAVTLTATARDLAEVMLEPDIESKSVKLAHTLEQQLEEVRSGHAEAAITVEESIANCSVVGNEMLRSVFRNLLKNAVQHNDKDVPRVTISTHQESEFVEVHIADNGPGITDEQKKEIFGKGEKGLDSEGTGIGLYLVETLVDAYGGSVWIEDNDPEGAVFVVKLPLAA